MKNKMQQVVADLAAEKQKNTDLTAQIAVVPTIPPTVTGSGSGINPTDSAGVPVTTQNH
ncbi:hypothetical protein AGMMS49921_04670 [Endomicrobiia bacterium]|nr:hypothetical protein AGMMS49921_04670 [Endomicrobiia bacterium]